MSDRLKINSSEHGILKVLLSFFLLFLASLSTSAQNDNTSDDDFDENPSLHMGVKAGLGLSNIQSRELDSNQSIRLGMVVGLYANYQIKKKVLLQIEFDGSLRGANFTYSRASSLQKISLFYFDVPITVHYGNLKKSKLLPFVGGQPSLIFRKDAYKSQEAVPQPDVLDIKKYDFAVTAGILYRMTPKVALQIQANYGLININNHLAISFYPYLGNGTPMYNRNLQLCLVF